MIPFIQRVIDTAKGKQPFKAKRSKDWRKVRAEHLKEQPVCQVCGGIDKLEVHHIEPFHLAPTRELDPDNLVTLCESKKHGVPCHLFFGHLGNYRSFNTTVNPDAKHWRRKLEAKP